MSAPRIGIIMGSQSDWQTMKHAADLLSELDIAFEKKIVSAHRTPDRLWEYGKTAVDRGLKIHSIQFCKCRAVFLSGQWPLERRVLQTRL